MDDDLLNDAGRELIEAVRDHSLGETRKLIAGEWPDSPLYRSLRERGFTPEQIDVLWQYVLASTDNAIGFFLKHVDVLMARKQLSGELRARDGRVVGALEKMFELDKSFQFDWIEQFSRYAYETPFPSSEPPPRVPG
jgi:hypothetical protein